MEKLFTGIRDALVRGEDLVLCTIIASSGSTPRGSGAKMAVFADGSSLGTVGGGAVEYESIRLAKQALAGRKAFTHRFVLTKNQTADIGMICGGQVVVCFQFFAGGDPEAIRLAESVLSLFPQRKNAWLVTVLSEGAGARTGVYARDTGLLFLDGVPEEEILPLVGARAMLKRGEPGYYVEPLTRAGYVYVFGGGHVSRELVPAITHVDFSVIVYEDREEFADPALFPAAVGTVVGAYTELSRHIAITADDYVVIMTRGHQADFEVLEQALRTDAAYIGVIGSRHKIAATNKRLIEAGIPEEALSRVHTPIGLEVLAETPAEIAVSIAAELILCRAKRCGGSKA